MDCSSSGSEDNDDEDKDGSSDSNSQIYDNDGSIVVDGLMIMNDGDKKETKKNKEKSDLISTIDDHNLQSCDDAALENRSLTPNKEMRNRKSKRKNNNNRNRLHSSLPCSPIFLRRKLFRNNNIDEKNYYDSKKQLKSNINSNKEFILHNKAPMWNEVNQVYQLDFGGRVTQESAKNFQIELHGRQVIVLMCAVIEVDFLPFTYHF